MSDGTGTEPSRGNLTEAAMEDLRQALAAETERCLEAQKRLDRANTEFEEFLSLAAHHLREPLRDVGLNSQLLSETYSGRLDSEADRFLGHIRDGVARMQSVLTAMVEYGVTETGDRERSRVDMEAILLLALENRRDVESAVVTHDPLPAVMGDAGLLSKVLQHLIRNAVEYCGTAQPRIHISSRREPLEYVFSVQDNGPGIDPAFHARIFGVFKRLHEREYPGTGLGLAFCKKAIEGHGGRIWVESTVGAGSTFYFTLPPADQEFPVL